MSDNNELTDEYAMGWDAGVRVERERIRQLAKRESFTLYRPGNGPARQAALEVVPLAVLMQDQP